MTKIYENVFRSVNIGFVNEMKKICNEMNIDTYKVIEAARTKPLVLCPSIQALDLEDIAFQ